MTTREFDLVAIGTGSAASSAASRCRAAGWRVAVVDSRPFGGTCALRGCDPKKVFVGAAEAADQARRMKGHGLAAEALRIEWGALQEFKRSFTDPVPAAHEEGFAKKGIDTFHGSARFVSEDSMLVGGETLRARHFLIAVGAQPARLGIPGEELLSTSDDFLELETLPERIVFVGGGYVSFEFAHVAARAGAAATILHRSRRPLGGFDPDLVEVLVEETRACGAAVELETEVRGIRRSGEGFLVTARRGDREETFEADLVVHGAGRVPAVEDLDLEKAGIVHEKGRLRLNEFLQSVSNPRVYAAGDAAGMGLPLTPVASHDGKVAAENILEGNRRTPDYRGVPSVAFTIPPLATVGLGESAAREKGLRFRVNHQDTSSWYSTQRTGARRSAFKVLVEEGSERVLGAHLFGPGADELVNLFALAIRAGMTTAQLRDATFAYPSHASDLGYML